MRNSLPHKFQCQHPGCDRSFPKSEHLARHERIHSGSKPFSCTICNRRFARHDSMLRHSKLHESTVPESSPTAQNIRRPSDALRSAHSITFVDDFTALAACQASPAQQQTPRNVDRQASLRHSENEAASSQMNGMVGNDIVNDPKDMAMIGSMDESMDLGFDWGFSSEELFSLIRGESANIPATLPVPQYSPETLTSGTGGPLDYPSPGRNTGSVDASRHAVQSMSKMLKDLPSKIMSELEENHVTSSFFDDCLDLFFTRFLSTMPIIHKPTFVARNCGPTLLLNMLALGSSFIGSKDAVSRGESFWSLAHAVVATSWQTLMCQRGPRDECDGVQLVLTAALGQTYALLSKNNNLRMTSQIFHSLGLYWSRQCGMYDATGFQSFNVPSLDMAPADKMELWQTWAASETQLRAVLGHYILDGQIAQFSGNPTCVRHVINPLPLPIASSAFEATTPDAWIVEMAKVQSPRISFREFILGLFHRNEAVIGIPVSDFSIRVVLEGLQSLVLEESEADGNALGTPSKAEISAALLQLDRWQISKSADATELSLRWHSIFLSMTVDTGAVCRTISSACGIQQSLYSPANRPVKNFHLATWAASPDARRALLHAFAIQDLLQDLPFGRAHAIHVPSAIFAAATVQAATLLSGTHSVVAPACVDWHAAWSPQPTPPAAASLASTTTTPASASGVETTQFLNRTFAPLAPRLHARKPSSALHALRMQLRALTRHWGVSRQMESLMEQWHQALRPER